MHKFFIQTFGCVQNTADSERIKAYFWEKGYVETKLWQDSDVVVINTCIIRESAENRAYGLLNNVKLENDKRQNRKIKIVLTGCLVGLHDKKNKIDELKKKLPMVDEFLPIEKISFGWQPVRDNKKAAIIPISSGCNNFCSYCIVPYARGKEISRPMQEILSEVDEVISRGFTEVILVGQNVNSYGSDFSDETVAHMGKKRFKSKFHQLLSEMAKKKIAKISFVSSNPWDFSDELIETIAKYKNIDRLLHLPIQAGDDEILKRMNRGYTVKDYLGLIKKIRNKIEGVKISTDIIIGFPGETEEIFEREVEVFGQCDFDIAYLNKYSPRKGTVSAKMYQNDVPQSEKKRRWTILNEMINKKD